jgi:predicted extracellular nuclease
VTFAPSAQAAPSPSVVISEVYGGGGNTGATYTNDFVELYNASDSAVDLTGWTVQYFSSGGTSTPALTLSGSIGAHHAYLVQEAQGLGGTTPLPAPDATGTAAMSGTSGRVDLSDGTAALVDRVGYGAATTFEGAAAAPGLSNTTADARIAPCGDTDQNGVDFAPGDPTPENSAVATPVCAGGGGGPVGTPATIEQIQGAAHVSPLKGQAVIDVEGVVTATSTNGFWFQSTHPDSDLSTSEGLFAFTSSAPTAHIGDDVSVAGTVTEFRPGGATSANLSTTEVSTSNAKVSVTSSGNALPAPVVLGIDRVAPAQTIESGNPGDVENAGTTFDPSTNAIDFDESLEGMRVALKNAKVVGPTNTSFGETPIVPGNAKNVVTTPRGGVLYSGYDHPNAARLIASDSLLPDGTGPVADVGDRFSGTTVGIMDYNFGNFFLELTAPPTVASGGIQREVTAAPIGTQLAVATFNVENLAPSDPQTKFDRLAGQIVHNLQAPDLVALEEIQDNSGAADDGTVASDQTVAKLEAAISAAGGPTYHARWIDPNNDTDCGQPGGNIRQVFMYRTDRGLGFVDRPGGDANTAVEVKSVGSKPFLSVSPGRIDPSSSAWSSSRKPLVGEFTWKGKTLFVVANHFASKGGDNPLFGRFQQPVRSSEVQRHQQAQEVRTFVDQLQAVDPKARIVVLGDLNDFEFSQTADILVGSGTTALKDLPRTLPVRQRYSYVFDGNSQVLDQIMVSQSWPGVQYDIVHTNSEFHDQDSDHDPQVVRLPI